MQYLEEMKTAWTPDLVGPIYKKRRVTLREVLNSYRDDKWTRLMTTFVPDELIYEPDLTKKDFRKFNAVLALVDVSRLFDLHEKHCSAENGGSFALIDLLNSYISIVVEEVYYTKGDVLKFSRSGLLVMWKVNSNDFFSRMVYSVILNSQKILASIAMVKSKIATPKADIAIAAGELFFSVIGDESSRHFVISGMPIEDLKHARRICLPGDLVLASSAWEHCAPSQYEYVIKDSSNVKIIKVLGPPTELEKQQSSFPVGRPSEGSPSIDYEIYQDRISTLSDISLVSDIDLMPFQARVSTFEALKRRLGSLLETYMMASVLDQIIKDRPLEYLTEVKRVTVVSVNVLPSKCSVYELISMVDELYRLLQNIAQQYSGHVSVSNIYDKDILFCVLYGIRGQDSRQKEMNRAKRGVLSALQIMDEMKRVSGVKAVFIGISTGMAFCGVIGHAVRRQYMIFGTPIDKAVSLMSISYGKMSCDYDTIFYSNMSKERFRSKGMKTLHGVGKFHVYEVLDTYPYLLSGTTERPLNVEYIYPILGRVQEVEYFKDILDEIGVPGRTYSGLLIEGNERSGKSRLLDAFVTVVRNRQIKLVAVPLHLSHEEKEYAVLYEVLLQLFDTVDCTTINDRERILLDKLTSVLPPKDFCYLNVIMRVQFPHSDEYCGDSDWKRHKKTVMIFQAILNKVVGNVCILLDDVQYMDVLSWQFLSAALEKDNVVLVMTLLEPVSWDNLTQVEAGICEDKRLMNRSLLGLTSEYLAAFACQFLNVFAIPSSLEVILKKRSKNAISWCEAFLMTALQTEALTFVTLSPLEAQHYNLVFPDPSLLAKIPADMTPEDVAPPMHWSKMNAIYVCVPSGRLLSFLETDRDVTGLRIDIYNRMNSYEQDFIKCAAALGGVFLRSMLENVMTNSAPLYTAKGKSAVAEMLRLRILECGMIQRKHFHMDESIFCLFKKRRTFSNMHHSDVCDCRPTRTFGIRSLPSNAHCKLLEFTIGSYRKLLYDILPPHEKKEYHTKAANIVQRNARKCSTCGGGNFLAIFSKEDSLAPSVEPMSSMTLSMQRRLTLQSRSDLWESRRSIFQPDDDALKRRESVNIRRISILPAYSDSIEGVTFESGKPTFASSEPTIDVSWEGQLKQFSHIDYRNCRCSNAINYLFWYLHCHIWNAMDVEKLIKSMFEYTAGLIQTAQFAFAIKFLATNSADIEIIKIKEHMLTNISDTNVTKGNTFILMGDAYMAYGYYSQAKKYYTEAAALRSLPLHTPKEVCYSTIFERLRYMLRGFSSYPVNQSSSQTVIETLETSVYMQRLSTILMLEEQPKMARLIVLQSLRSVFKCMGGFVEKCRIYITAVDIFLCYGYYDLLRSLEKPMMVAIETKTNWNSVEEMSLLADVYQRLYENRVLRGDLVGSVEIGTKLLKICNCLHIATVKLAILPSLIEVLVWLKRLNEAVDLLKELYFSAKEDIDQSSITWYYALCLELLLDAGMGLESYEACLSYHSKVIICRGRSCVSRDPESLMRLTTCLGIWQLRMIMPVLEEFILDVDVYTKDIHRSKFSQIYNCVKGLESYLLILNRRINIKQSNDLIVRLENANTLRKVLRESCSRAPFVKPFLYLLQSYMNLQRGRRAMSRYLLRKSHKWSSYQQNQMMLAWVMQNKRTWTEKYNNMAGYWSEHMGTSDTIRWQEIHAFDLDTWSTIMFPLPIPDSTI